MKTPNFEIYAVPYKNDDGTISESFRVVSPDDLDGYRETRPINFPTLAEAEEWVRIQLIPETPARLVKRIRAKPHNRAERDRINDEGPALLADRIESESNILTAIVIIMAIAMIIILLK